jgi:hypothetical protein
MPYAGRNWRIERRPNSGIWQCQYVAVDARAEFMLLNTGLLPRSPKGADGCECLVILSERADLLDCFT